MFATVAGCSGPSTTWAPRWPRSRSASSTSRPPARPPPTATSPRWGRSSCGAASAWARSRPWSTRRPRSPSSSPSSPASPSPWWCRRRRSPRSCPPCSSSPGDTVIVGHNVRFDISFLQAALANEGYPRLGNQWVDTCALARRLVRDEVPDCRLATLAERMRLPHQPSHRALADALATADLLHALLERAGTIGVLGLDDLFELPTIRAHPQVGKLKLTAKLPRAPGRLPVPGLGGRVLYVGKATNLRARVRSYFGGDERRKISQLLRETETIDHIVCSGPLEAAVLEVRLIHRHLPPFNHRSKLWSRYAYLKLTLNEAFPRLSVVRTVKAGDGCLYLGPLSSTGAARQVAEAIESAVPLRRCTARPPGRPRAPPPPGRPCAPPPSWAWPPAPAPAPSARPTTPCSSTGWCGASPSTPRSCSSRSRPACATWPSAERFEEAADVRDRASALARALTRHRRLDSLRRAGRVELDVDGARVVLAGGRLSPSGPLALFDADNAREPEPGRRPRRPPPPPPGRRGRVRRRLARRRRPLRPPGLLRGPVGVAPARPPPLRTRPPALAAALLPGPIRRPRYHLPGGPTAMLTASATTSIAVRLESRLEAAERHEHRDLDVYRRHPGGGSPTPGARREERRYRLRKASSEARVGSRTCEWSKRERAWGSWSLASADDTQMVETGSAPG